MPTHLLGPRRSVTKPRPWRITPRAVAPEWKWAWTDALMLVPLWVDAGLPFDNARDVRATSTSAPSWTVGEVGLAANFDRASSQFLDFGISDALQTLPQDDFTISVDATVGTIGAVQTLIAAGDGTQWWAVQVTSPTATNNEPTVQADDDVAKKVIALDNHTVSGGERHTFTFMRRGGDYVFYFDGIERGSTAISGSFSVEENVNFGRIPWNNDSFWDGEIHAAYIWDRALEATQVAQWHRDTFGPLRPQRIATWGTAAAPAPGGGLPVAVATYHLNQLRK